MKIESFGIYNSQIERPNISISKLRKSTMFEVELPLENGGVSFIDSNKHKIENDVIIFSKPGQERHTKFPFKCYYIHLFIYDECLLSELESLTNFIKVKNVGIYKALFEEIIKFGGAFSNWDEIMLKSLFLKLVYCLLNESADENGATKIKHNSAVEKAIKYIDENLSEDLTLETVSGFVALSPIYFHNCFKNITGKTLHGYIEEKRIEKAVNLMLTRDMTLTEIAYECGFSSQSYFSFAFKRKLNMSPRKYIKVLNGNYEK